MNESVKISCQRIDDAFASQNHDAPQLLDDAYKLVQYVRHVQAMLRGGDAAIQQLEMASDTYRRERDAAHHVILEAGVVPVKDTHCACEECQSVLQSMQAAGYATTPVGVESEGK